MPKPADIIKIMQPTPKERKWCSVAFLDIKRRKRENQFITATELRYCNDYVDAIITAPDDEKAELERNLQIANQEDKQYWSC